MITELSGFIIVALTLYFEAAFEPIEAKIAIANTIRNGANRAKITYAEECTKPKRFSCWNGNKRKEILDAYNTGILNKQRWEECKEVSLVLFDDRLPKQPFTNYYNPDLIKPNAKAWKWIKQMKNTKRIGSHIFGVLK